MSWQLRDNPATPALPDAAATWRLRRYEMAIADIMGTLLAALLCILMSTVHLIGLAERSNRTIARFGVGSLVILVIYAGGMLLLLQLR